MAAHSSRNQKLSDGDRATAIRALNAIATSATSSAEALCGYMAEDTLPGTISFLESQLERLRRVGVNGTPLGDLVTQLDARMAEGMKHVGAPRVVCPECSSTRTEPTGDNGRVCQNCGCAYTERLSA